MFKIRKEFLIFIDSDLCVCVLRFRLIIYCSIFEETMKSSTHSVRDWYKINIYRVVCWSLGSPLFYWNLNSSLNVILVILSYINNVRKI